MAIIIEGPDNSGKTHLAALLAEKLRLPIIHSKKHGTPENHQALCDKDLSNMLKPVIMDRSFILSEMVYGPTCRGAQLFDPSPYLRLIQSFVQHSPECCIIFCTAPRSVLLDMSTHVIRPEETAAHLQVLRQQKSNIINVYDTLYTTLSLFMDIYRINPRTQGEDFVSDIHLILERN